MKAFMLAHSQREEVSVPSSKTSTSALRRLKQALGRYLIPRVPVTRRLFQIIRREVNAKWVQLNCVWNPVYICRRRRFETGKELSINIGCGPFGKEGWVNLDLMKMPVLSLRFDCRTALPLSDRSAKRIRCEHFLEHLDFHDEVPLFLKSCFRVLESGGTLRIVVPDVASYLHAYCSDEKQEWASLGVDVDNLPHDIITRMGVLNHVFHQGGEHLYGYDYETLEVCLRQAGFRNVFRSSFANSLDPDLRDDLPNHSRYSLYVDAVK